MLNAHWNRSATVSRFFYRIHDGSGRQSFHFHALAAPSYYAFHSTRPFQFQLPFQLPIPRQKKTLTVS